MRIIRSHPLSTVIQLVAETRTEHIWLKKNCYTEPWQWQGWTLSVDQRAAPAIVNGAWEAGFFGEAA